MITRDSLDVLITATRRPSVLMETLDSFANNMFGTENCKAIVNIDPVGEDDPGGEKTLSVVKKYFAEYLVNLPGKPNFAAAFKWVWSEARSPYVLHLEDDWKLLKRVYIEDMIEMLEKFNNLALLRLPKFRAKDGVMKNWNKFFHWNGFFFPCPEDLKRGVGFSGHPSLIKLDFIKACAPLLNDYQNPEKQFHTWNKPLIAEVMKWQYGVYGVPTSGAYIEDIGTRWRRQTRWTKKGISAFFTEWEQKEAKNETI